MIAAAIAVLRSADMKNYQIKEWLAGELGGRALDFTVDNAMRWFFDCNSGKVPLPQGTLEAFESYRPAPVQSLTVAEAKERAANILDTVAALKARPLTQTPRRRG
jgi:hypothetical protein